MSSFEIGVLAVILYICAYGIVNRICKCVELIASYKYTVKENLYEQSRNETNAAGAEKGEDSYL
jgi:hypothetical protein